MPDFVRRAQPPEGAAVFRARLHRITIVRWAYLRRRAVDALNLPPAPMQGKGRGLSAILRFGDDVDRVTVLPGKPGFYKVAFKVELLKSAGVDAGDTVEFTLEPDTASRVPELPEEMRRHFQARPELAARWTAHSIALRRQVIRYIDQARMAETRTKRCWLFLDRLAETGKLGGSA